ncbi:hypothetical protein TNCV_4846471 [Trichonephila clavipes]|uniref:Uncharacterized protein n=1 Tax=Trichonephila clavipes TaxID=2585209 RepID=A0A8X6WJW8_TRICX|nr:hypothetical protein TNCV_4846471 [Trichonephila clavipes]
MVVKVTDLCLVCPEFEPSAVENPPYRGGQCTFNLARLKRPPIGVVWKERWCQLRGHPRLLTMIQITRSVTNSPRPAL